jgi:hypothetical protein
MNSSGGGRNIDDEAFRARRGEDKAWSAGGQQWVCIRRHLLGRGGEMRGWGRDYGGVRWWVFKLFIGFGN